MNTPAFGSKDLFSPDDSFVTSDCLKNAPLAVRMRPQTIDEVVGQDHLLAEGKLLRRTLTSDRWPSMIFYGPPGVGKTTFAKLISKLTSSRFIPLNAVASNVAELRKVIQEAKQILLRGGPRTIVFVDEIHRFNKSQQDVLMPDVENGHMILLGATTHNPSFSINGPLLSRSIVFELRSLEEEGLIRLMKRAISDKERGLGKLKIKMTEEALMHLAKSASGDARRALTALEVGALTTPPNADNEIIFDAKVAEESSQRRVVYYDKDEDYHYDTISAFIKSMRGSDPDAAVYWLAKMLYGGEEPRFIMRRILIFASEDIGNADPQALILANSGLQAIEFVGMPESRIILAQLVTYMSLAPKSNSSYVAISKAYEDVENQGTQEVPSHLRDKHYFGARKLGHGEGYIYPHGKAAGELPIVAQEYLPIPKKYYRPANIGYEKVLKERLDVILRQRDNNSPK